MNTKKYSVQKMAGKKKKTKNETLTKILQLNPTTTSRITLNINIYSFPRNTELYQWRQNMMGHNTNLNKFK